MAIPTLHGAGCERVVAELLPALQQKYRVDLILQQDAVDYPVPAKVTVRHLGFDVSAEHGSLYKALRFARKVWAIGRLLRKYKYEVVLSFIDMNNVAVYLARTLFCSGTRLVASERTASDLFYSANRYAKKTAPIVRRALRLVYTRCYRVIVNSNAMKLYLSKKMGVRRRIDVIYNGIDIDKFNIHTVDDGAVEQRFVETPVRILNVARLDDNKNHLFLIRGLRRVLCESPQTHLFILGQGPNEKKLKRCIAQEGLSDSVSLLGWRNNVEDYMGLAHVLVLTSRYESFGNVLVEAMACGCPVVATKSTDALAEILDGQNYGTLVEQDDALSLENAVVETIATKSVNGEYRHLISAYARAKFNRKDKHAQFLRVIG